MIAEFTVENFRSFKERHSFSLIASKDKELLDSNTFETDKKLRFLKSAVIYGANASGKSNFFNALNFFLKFSIFSGPRKQAEEPIEIEPFELSKQTESAPSSFEIIFVINDANKDIRYRYGFSVNKERVENEYLFAVNNVREVMLFDRNLQEINCSPNFKEGTRSKASVRKNCSFLSVCAQNNGEIATQIVKYFNSIVVIYGIRERQLFSDKNIKNIEIKKKIIDFLKFADLQIINYKAEKVSLNTSTDVMDHILVAYLKNLKSNFQDDELERVIFGHIVYDKKTPVGEKYFNEYMESAGTQKLFSYSDIILNTLEKGIPLFIDEFDTSLHPLIIEGIIKLFNSKENNPNNAQLVISCHAVNIMTNKLFRRDQIWFCEKDQYGATDLYSLVEYKEPVRKDATYNKNYLQGKYGAIPYLDEILIQNRNNNEE